MLLETRYSSRLNHRPILLLLLLLLTAAAAADAATTTTTTTTSTTTTMNCRSQPDAFCRSRHRTKPFSQLMSRYRLHVDHRGFIFLLLLFLLLPSSVFPTSLAQCIPSQRNVLRQFKAGFRTLNGSKLDFWEREPDCCRWRGVTCDDNSGEVTGLDLSGWFISGNVSTSLFNLTSLRTFNLAYNYFNTSIPPGLERLGNLTHLNLSNSGFVGQVPAGISRLVNLELLDLSYSYAPADPLKLENPNLKILLKNLNKLQKLHLDNVDMSATGGDWSSTLSESVPDLRVLSLSSCSLSGRLHSSLFNLRFLTELRLDHNNFSSELPASLGNLTSFFCSQCNLSGSLPEAIFRRTNLISLDISFNPWLTGSLPDSIGNLQSLKSLQLSNCNFSGKIPSTVEKLAKLVKVDLSFNNFSGRIPDFNLSAGMSEIIFANNSFTGSIPSTFGRLQNLTILNLQDNLLNGSVPSSLFVLPSLQSLLLSHNLLSGQLKVPPNVSSSFRIVDLNSNKLQGPIPRYVFNLSGLKVLKLGYNNFSGTAHLNSLQNLKNLSSIDLSNNMLTVKVEDGGFSFPNISSMRLAFCNMSEFPGFLRNQRKLNYLDLSGNRLDGRIPSWLWNVGKGTFSYLNLSFNSLTGFEKPVLLSNSSLSVIDLHSNKLKGPILLPPPSNSFIDYSNNSFGSSIPPNISEHLKRTIFFSVSMNNIHGDLPQSICSSSYLRVLDVSRNNLSRKIPSCLAQMVSLSVLNLRYNNFSGTIQMNYTEGCKLRTLNLYRNQLNGRLPPSLRNCKELEVLDLGNNKMSGKVPSWLAGLSKLRVLVLRSNKFSGRLRFPRSSNKISFNMLQIIDLSSNNFTGNLPWEYFRHLQSMVRPDEKAGNQVLEIGYLTLTKLYYQDTVMVTSKGLEVTLVKILTIFTAIDISNNGFEGAIPEDFGKLKSLYILNMSHNSLTGEIPYSIGNITQLGSLDLSENKLSGKIPPELTSLTFLSFLNLSYNNLVGEIPSGKQFSTFSNWSFIGNPRLCGQPLTQTCPNSDSENSVPKATEFNGWFIFLGLGFGGGLGMVFGSLLIWKKGRRLYNMLADKILQAVLPSNIWHLADCWLGSVDIDGRLNEDFMVMTAEGPRRPFCLFCTRLEFSSSQVRVHHVECSCASDNK